MLVSLIYPLYQGITLFFPRNMELKRQILAVVTEVMVICVLQTQECI